LRHFHNERQAGPGKKGREEENKKADGCSKVISKQRPSVHWKRRPPDEEGKGRGTEVPDRAGAERRSRISYRRWKYGRRREEKEEKKRSESTIILKTACETSKGKADCSIKGAVSFLRQQRATTRRSGPPTRTRWRGKKGRKGGENGPHEHGFCTATKNTDAPDRGKKGKEGKNKVGFAASGAGWGRYVRLRRVRGEIRNMLEPDNREKKKKEKKKKKEVCLRMGIQGTRKKRSPSADLGWTASDRGKKREGGKKGGRPENRAWETGAAWCAGEDWSKKKKRFARRVSGCKADGWIAGA